MGNKNRREKRVFVKLVNVVYFFENINSEENKNCWLIFTKKIEIEIDVKINVKMRLYQNPSTNKGLS